MLFWVTTDALFFDGSKGTPDGDLERKERKDFMSSSRRLWPGKKGDGCSYHTIFMTL